MLFGAVGSASSHSRSWEQAAEPAGPQREMASYTKMAERRDVMQHRQDMIGDGFDLEGNVTETPMSRTHQYRKVMKPLLERKRRARINTCLEELKDNQNQQGGDRMW